MLQSLKGSSKLTATMGRIKYQRKTGKEKRLITKQEMWKRTTIAHSALLCSKEENLFYPPKKNFRESTTQLYLEMGLKDLNSH